MINIVFKKELKTEPSQDLLEMQIRHQRKYDMKKDLEAFKEQQEKKLAEAVADAKIEKQKKEAANLALRAAGKYLLVNIEDDDETVQVKELEDGQNFVADANSLSTIELKTEVVEMNGNQMEGDQMEGTEMELVDPPTEEDIETQVGMPKL